MEVFFDPHKSKTNTPVDLFSGLRLFVEKMEDRRMFAESVRMFFFALINLAAEILASSEGAKRFSVECTYGYLAKWMQNNSIRIQCLVRALVDARF